MSEGIQNKIQVVTDKPVLQINNITTLKRMGKKIANVNSFGIYNILTEYCRKLYRILYFIFNLFFTGVFIFSVREKRYK